MRPRGVTLRKDRFSVHLFLLPELERSPRGVAGCDKCYVRSCVRSDRVAGGCQLITGINYYSIPIARYISVLVPLVYMCIWYIYILKYARTLWLKVLKINVSGDDAWMLSYYFRAVNIPRKTLATCYEIQVALVYLDARSKLS